MTEIVEPPEWLTESCFSERYQISPRRLERCLAPFPQSFVVKRRESDIVDDVQRLAREHGYGARTAANAMGGDVRRRVAVINNVGPRSARRSNSLEG